MKKYLELAVFVFFINTFALSCSNQYEKDLEFARSLSEEQLTTLFNEMEFHWRRLEETPVDGLTNYPENSHIPENLPNLLAPRAVNPRKGFIVIRPAIDEDIRLHFIGMTDEEWPIKYQAVQLHYYIGMSPTSEILWERGQKPNF